VKFVNGYPEKKRTAVVSVTPLTKLHRADPCALAVGRTILNKAAYECQYVDVFWEAYLPYSRAASPLAAQYSTTGWTAIAQRLYPDHELLKLALGAFSFCAVGRKSDDEWMMVKGRSLYGMALQEMARALRSSEKDDANDDVIITASKILNLFEVSAHTNMACGGAHADTTPCLDRSSSKPIMTISLHNTRSGSATALARKPYSYAEDPPRMHREMRTTY
jgi:hypothetical protein